MTVSALARPFQCHVPVQAERFAAGQLRTLIAESVSPRSGEAKLRLTDASDEQCEICLPADMSKTLLHLLRMISQGQAVTLVPLTEMLTTQRAADMLNVSRPHLIKLLEAGEMPFELVGRHRRILAQDLFEYKARRDRERQALLND